MQDRRVEGTIVRVEYHFHRRRILHLVSNDGEGYAVSPTWYVDEQLPKAIVGCRVDATISQGGYKPGTWYSSWMGVIEEAQTDLGIDTRPVVIVDSNEASQNRLNLADFNDFGFRAIESDMKETGQDYVLSSRVAVQRKAIDDLCSSIADGRLFNDLTALSSNCQIPILLIEGLEPEHSKMLPSSIDGVLAYLSLAYDDIRIIQRPDRPSMMRYMRSIVLKEQTEGKHRLPYLKDWLKNANLEEKKLALLQQLPGVGPSRALNVLKHKETVVSSIGMDELDWVPFVGRNKAKEILQVTKTPFNKKELA